MVYDFTQQEIVHLKKKKVVQSFFDSWTIWILVKKRDEVTILSTVEIQG